MAHYNRGYSRYSTRDHFVEPPSVIDRFFAALPGELAALLQRLLGRAQYTLANSNTFRIPRTAQEVRQRFHPRAWLNLPNAFIVVWIFVLLWGERWVFEGSINACGWANWERWPRAATPHHLIFLADPQLVDPHTYPERPWPLSTMTIRHTDYYLSRSYIQLQKSLHPDTIFFLGDLFDGGREWVTRQGDSDDPSWAAGQRPANEQALIPTWRKKYDEDFWLREYNRFGKIFFGHWNDGGESPGLGQRGRKIISSLPGNHDLGFAANIKIPVRNRFEAYFGDTNRVDVIGNHTFVSIDSVSLSAASVDQEGVDTREIYQPVEKFLENVKPLKRKAVARELRYQNGDLVELRQEHNVIDLDKAEFSHLPSLDPGEGSSSLPTILLTHVPLYRAPGTPCGPLREHWPPSPPTSGQTESSAKDERNSISISKGYQYQNVLSDNDSKRLISEIGDVVHVFSGDDHDYCDVVHHDKSNVREITVKSISWAMGVRKPGFLMLSLWNPVDASGTPIGTHGGGHGAASASIAPTLETHLCLLPDQIGIFIRYALLVGLTVLALLTRAILTPLLGLDPFSAPPTSSTSISFLLPTSSKDTTLYRDYDQEDPPQHHDPRSSTSSTSSNNGVSTLAPRNAGARTRSISPAPGGYGLPSNQARYVPPVVLESTKHNSWLDNEDGSKGVSGLGMKDRAKVVRMRDKDGMRRMTKTEIVVREVWTSIFRVAWVVAVWVLYLAYYG